MSDEFVNRGELVVEDPMPVYKLAGLLGQQPFKIIGDLMAEDCFTKTRAMLDFETIARIARKYGYVAKRPAPPQNGSAQ